MTKTAVSMIFVLIIIVLTACGSSDSNVNGEITFNDPGALPLNSTVTVQIQDTSLADAAAIVIGEQIITNAEEFPIQYSVDYDADEIVDNHSYSMSVRITDSEGKLLFINDTVIPVITRDSATDDVEIPVIQVGR